MNTSLFKNFGYGLVMAYLGLAVSACNTTKATADTMVIFVSSKLPGDLFTGDGLVEEHHKVSFYTGAVFENLQEDLARGDGQYLTSLGVLLEIPPDRRHEWALFTQSRYSVLFASDRAKANEMLGGLAREFAAAPDMSRDGTNESQ
jgi:hypothetical protein